MKKEKSWWMILLESLKSFLTSLQEPRKTEEYKPDNINGFILAPEYWDNTENRLQQTDEVFPLLFKNYGCFVRAEMGIGETATGKTLNAEQANHVIEAAIDAGAVILDDNDYYVVFTQGWVANYTAQVLGHNKKIMFINSEPAIRHIEGIPYAILKVTTAYGVHFIEANNKGEIRFNPDKNIIPNHVEWFILYVEEEK